MTTTPGAVDRHRTHPRTVPLLLCALSLALGMASGLASPSWAAAKAHVTGTVSVAGDPGEVTAEVQRYNADFEFWQTVADVPLDSRGGFAFAIPAGSYRVCASGAGYENACFGEGDSGGSPTTVDVAAGATVVADFGLQLMGTLSGTVRKANGSVAPDVEVLFYNAEEQGDEYSFYDSVTTQSNGTWSFALPHGKYKIGFGRFNPDETSPAQPEFYNNKHAFALAETRTVAPATRQTGLNAQLDTGATISGHVNGPTDELERADVRVTAYAEVNGKWTERRGRALDTATGNFVLDGLPTGTYRICVGDITLWRGGCLGGDTVKTATNIAVTAPSTSAGRNLTMVVKGTVSGRVLGAGKALEGIDVHAISTQRLHEDGYAESATTDDTGHYTLPLLPGTYALRFVGDATWAPEYYDNTLDPDKAAVFTVADGSTATAKDATLVKGGSITGAVKTGHPDDGLEDLDVEVTNNATGQAYADQTDSAGKYAVRGLPAGAYTVSFIRKDNSNALRSAPEFYKNVHEGRAAHPTPVTLTAGQARTGISATLEKGAIIKGRVVYDDGTPVTGCPVHAAVDDAHFSHRYVFTRADGSFTLVGLGAGKITLAVGQISADDPECGFGTRFYDGDDVLRGTPSAAGVDTTLGRTSSAGTLVYGDSAVAETSTAPATITGTRRVGTLLTASEGSWNLAPTSYSYAWFDNGSPISGATARTFKPGAALLDHQISVTVTAHKSGVTDGTATSAAVAVRAGIVVTRQPSISGTAKVGKTLRYVAGTTTPASTSRSYRWLRDGKAISGATRTTRKLTSADKNHLISLKVTYRKTGYAAVGSKTATKRVTAG